MALKYITLNDAKLRVAGKIRFTDDAESEPDKMSNQLARQLIEEAEADVEQDLSERYEIPFQTVAGGAFSTLPTTTLNMLKKLVRIKSTLKLLETDFGSGTPVTADEYTDKLEERYDKVRDRIVERRKDTYQQWLYPPLKDLMLAPHNDAADDGTSGTIHVTGQGDGDFPQAQINDPRENFWNGEVDSLGDS